MSAILENLSFDQFSFWIGVLSGVLGFWLITKLAPSFPGFWRRIQSNSQIARTTFSPNSSLKLKNDTLRHVQGLHLASALFSLDEIIVEPRLMTMPQLDELDENERILNSLSTVIPYMPDWPELAAYYGLMTISLADALSAGANIILIGKPGSGKTVALANLVCQIARHDGAAASVSKYLPIYLHLADALPDGKFTDPSLNHLLRAVSSYSDSMPSNRLERVLTNSLLNGRALLLIDGLDEVSQSTHLESVSFISDIRKSFPRCRMVVSASPENISGLAPLGFMPAAMAAWNHAWYVKFVHKWSSSWWRFIRPAMQAGSELIDPRLLNAWLLADTPVISPFDATIKAWAVFAGDASGPGYLEAIESYIKRMTSHLPKARRALEDFSLQLMVLMDVALDLKRARVWQAEFKDLEHNPQNDKAKTAAAQKMQSKPSTRNLPAIVPELLENGLLVERTKNRFSLSHPLIAAYLASCAIADAPVSHFLSSQSDWTGKTLTTLFQAATKNASPEITDLLSKDDDLHLRAQLKISQWLHYIPEGVSWRNNVLRFLADRMQQRDQPAGLRARLLTGLLISDDSGVNVLLRQLSHTSIDDLRRMTALGLGYLRDTNACNLLGEMFKDQNLLTVKAACMALVRIGSKQAFEILGRALLNENETVRRSVAEAFALDQREGQEILREASQMEDLLVRRSAVFGLAQVDSSWAGEILEKLALEDQEWVVRTAAEQSIEQKNRINRLIPQPLPPLHETPWLIAFAGERGMGIAPGKPAENLLLSALDEGKPNQQLAALRYLRQNPIVDALPILHSILKTGNYEIQNAAFDTIWFYSISGIEINELTFENMS